MRVRVSWRYPRLRRMFWRCSVRYCYAIAVRLVYFFSFRGAGFVVVMRSVFFSVLWRVWFI